MMEFRGKLNDLSYDREGNVRITLTSFVDCREAFDELAKDEVDVVIKAHRKKRSLSANAYLWVIIDRISEVTGVPKSEIYRNNIRDIGGVSQIICCQEKDAKKIIDLWQTHGLGWQTEVVDSKIDGCVNLILYAGSSEYNTQQMSRLIDNVVQDAKNLGIETLPPEELERMLGKWGEEKNGRVNNAG